MLYFIETEQLFSQESFLRYVEPIYAEFIDLEDHARLDMVNLGETFNITPKRWLQLAKNKEPRRIFSGGSGSFLLYIRQNIQELIFKDWRKAKVKLSTKEKERGVKLFHLVQEVEDIKSLLPLRSYLAPVSGVIADILNGILEECSELSLASPKITIVG